MATHYVGGGAPFLLINLKLNVLIIIQLSACFGALFQEKVT